jgi:hypothetical protein
MIELIRDHPCPSVVKTFSSVLRIANPPVRGVHERAEFQDQRVLIQFFVETPLQFVEDGHSRANDGLRQLAMDQHARNIPTLLTERRARLVFDRPASPVGLLMRKWPAATQFSFAPQAGTINA